MGVGGASGHGSAAAQCSPAGLQGCKGLRAGAAEKRGWSAVPTPARAGGAAVPGAGAIGRGAHLAARGAQGAVGGDGDGVDVALVAHQVVAQLAVGQVPHLRVGGKAGRQGWAGLSWAGAQRVLSGCPGGPAPQAQRGTAEAGTTGAARPARFWVTALSAPPHRTHLDSLVPARRHDDGVLGHRGEAHAGDPLGVAVRLANGVLALAQGVPQLDGLVAGAGHDLQGRGECVREGRKEGGGAGGCTRLRGGARRRPSRCPAAPRARAAQGGSRAHRRGGPAGGWRRAVAPASWPLSPGCRRMPTWRLSAEKATDSTSLAWPRKRRVVAPVVMSHRRRVPSQEPVRQNWPSEEMTTSCRQRGGAEGGRARGKGWLTVGGMGAGAEQPPSAVGR